MVRQSRSGRPSRRSTPAGAPPAPAPEPEAPPQAPAREPSTAPAQPAPSQPAAAQAPAAAEARPTNGNGAAARMTPAVRRLVREHNIDVAQLSGSGAGGRVTRDDVLAFINQGAATATPTPQAP